MLIVSLIAAASTGCGSGGDIEPEATATAAAAAPEEFEPTAAFLAEVVETTTAQPYRFELTISLGPAEEPLVTGASDGERVELHVDANSLPENIAGDVAADYGLPDFDRTFDAVVDGAAVYVRSPAFPALGEEGVSEQLPDDLANLAAAVGNGWGQVERSTFDDLLPAPLRDVDLAQGVDATAVEDLLDSAGGVDDLGTADVEGEEMRGLAAQLSIDEILTFLDIDASQVPLIGGLLTGPASSLEFPVNAWIDADNQLREVQLPVNSDTIADQDGSWDDLARQFLESMSFDVTLDVTDHGDKSISVEVPDNSVDVNDEFAAALDDLRDLLGV